MNNNVKATALYPVEQTQANCTSWIGHRHSDNQDIVGGQTFTIPSAAHLHNIALFSNVVAQPGKLVLTLHSFDTNDQQWGPAMGSSSVEVNNQHSGQWLSFVLPELPLNQGNSYGFRVQSTDSLIGLGESVGSHQQPPFAAGQEWQFVNSDQQGKAFSYFSLAFKLGLTA